MSLDLFISQPGDRKIVPMTGQIFERQKTQLNIFPFDFKIKPDKEQFNYNLGIKQNGTRFIDEDSVATINGRYFNAPENSIAFQIRQSQLYNIIHTIDGHIGNSSQGSERGNCYFLAAINSIRNTRYGQKLLNSNIKKHSDNSITVTLPGAIKIKNKYKADNKPCEVTGKYHITWNALIKAAKNAGLTYSDGDLEVIANELAMESYRTEMVITNQKNLLNWFTFSKGHPESEIDDLMFDNSGDFLSSGESYDAMYLLTGEKSDVYSAFNGKYKSLKRYKEYEFGSISYEEMKRRTSEKTKPNPISEFLLSLAPSKGEEISTYVRTEFGLSMLLEKYQGKEDNYALTCGVRVQKGSGATKDDGNHALSILKITNKTVYVANPWHPEEIEPIPRKTFEKMVFDFTATPIKAV